jgi:hypothetical protein
VTPTHRDGGPQWARCDDVCSSPSGAGTVVVAGGARAARVLAPAEHTVWIHAAEASTVPSLATACGLPPDAMRDILARLARLGLVQEVD